jgi:dATP pyrophosphohydrolase
MNIRHDMISCYVLRRDESGSAWEFLQLKRRDNDFMGGTWQIVYGGIDPHETAWQAALRELKEETALAPRELYRLEPVDIFYIAAQDTLWHCVQFAAVVDRSDRLMLNEEHTASRWITAHDAAAHFMWLANRQAVPHILQLLANDPAKPYARIDVRPPKRP